MEGLLPLQCMAPTTINGGVSWLLVSSRGSSVAFAHAGVVCAASQWLEGRCVVGPEDTIETGSEIEERKKSERRRRRVG